MSDPIGKELDAIVASQKAEAMSEAPPDFKALARVMKPEYEAALTLAAVAEPIEPGKLVVMLTQAIGLCDAVISQPQPTSDKEMFANLVRVTKERDEAHEFIARRGNTNVDYDVVLERARQPRLPAASTKGEG
jgi:hypothetical protein